MTRVQRLRAAVLAVSTDDLRAAVRGINEPTVAALPARTRPLVSQLRRSATPGELLRKIPDVALITLLADVLTDACLEATRDALGDAADDPTAEQLAEVIETVLADFDVAIVRVMLAIVAASEAEAADKCDALLERDERFALAAADSAPAARQPKPPAADEVQARRRERKQAEREARQRAAATARAANRPPKRAPAASPEATPTADAADPAVPVSSRRAPRLAPEEAKAFSADDPLVGEVVIAVVPFADPTSDIGAKARPCVVIGAAPGELLVRPGYSDGGVQSRRWQSYALRDWADAGCAKATFIEDGTRVIPRTDASEPIGRLTDDDWNALW